MIQLLSSDAIYSTLLQGAVDLLPTNLCVGVCKGDEWQIAAHNKSFVDFLCETDQQKQFFRGQDCSIIGESLFTLFYQAGASAFVESMRDVQPNTSANIVFRQNTYSFCWTAIPPFSQSANSAPVGASPSSEKDNPNDSETVRFFVLHKISQALRCNDSELLTEELEVIINSLHDGIWVIDSNGFTVHVNQAVYRITGLVPEDVLGKHVSVPMKEGKFTTCVTLSALEQKKTVTMFDDYASGNRCLNTSTPIFDDNGNVWRVVATIRDMPELEHLQKRLAEAELEARTYKRKLESMQQTAPAGFVIGSGVMRNYLRELEKAARTPASVIILGETGTGKTLAASIIHQKSPRANGPFVNVNCAAIPENLIESEFFGYEKGAFTGAGAAGKKGFFELAHKGTLLLDEIGELPLNMQAKLLHVLDNQTFHKIGGEKSIKVDIRIIAATNRQLDQLVENGEFRADLYYRLRVLNIVIPPLRERPDDIPELAMIFLDEACKRHGTVKTFSPNVLQCFRSYAWPGNVRELRAVVEFLSAMAESSSICLKDLPPYIFAGNLRGSSAPSETEEASYGLRQAVQTLEYDMIKTALAQTGSTYKAADLLGVSQSTVVRKARQLGITVSEPGEVAVVG